METVFIWLMVRISNNWSSPLSWSPSSLMRLPSNRWRTGWWSETGAPPFPPRRPPPLRSSRPITCRTPPASPSWLCWGRSSVEVGVDPSSLKLLIPTRDGKPELLLSACLTIPLNVWRIFTRSVFCFEKYPRWRPGRSAPKYVYIFLKKGNLGRVAKCSEL